MATHGAAAVCSTATASASSSAAAASASIQLTLRPLHHLLLAALTLHFVPMVLEPDFHLEKYLLNLKKIILY
jgi:hypothetical protein